MKYGMRILILWLCLPLFPACAPLNDRADFEEVRRDVHDRAGYDVAWNEGDQTAEKLTSLLSQPLTPDSAVRIALLNNPDLQASYYDLGISRASLVQAMLPPNPQFEADVKFVEAGEGEIVEMALLEDMVGLLMIGRKTDLARTELNVAGAVASSKIMDLALRVRTAFFRHQADLQILEMLKTELEAVEISYEMARRIRRAGNMTELDFLEQRAVYEELKMAVHAREIITYESRERLNRLMGLWGEEVTWQAAGALPELPESEPESQGLYEKALTGSLQLAVARNQVEIASRRVGIADVTSILPHLEIGVAAEREPDGEWAVGPAVSLPIPLFNQGQAGRAAARFELRKRVKEYEALAGRIRSALRTAYFRTRAARDRVLYATQVIVPLSRRIRDRTQIRYNGMLVGVFQLLEAKRREIDARRKAVDELFLYWAARTELDQILNGGRADTAPMAVSGASMDFSAMISAGEGH